MGPALIKTGDSPSASRTGRCLPRRPPLVARSKIFGGAEVADRRQSQNENDGGCDPNDPMLVRHPSSEHGYALTPSTAAIAKRKPWSFPQRPGCGRGGSLGGRGGFGKGGGFGLVVGISPNLSSSPGRPRRPSLTPSRLHFPTASSRRVPEASSFCP